MPVARPIVSTAKQCFAVAVVYLPRGDAYRALHCNTIAVITHANRVMQTEALFIATEHGPVSARLYRRDEDRAQAGALVLHLHGGAFAPGGLAQGECVAQLAAQAGAVVVDVDYPAGPQHPFPAALRLLGSLLQALYRRRLRWAGRGARLFVAGEEAGGNLAAALALMARDQGGPPLAGQVLIGPMLNPCLGTSSLRTALAGSGAAECDWSRGWRDYLGACEQGDHPYAAPGAASRLAGLAPALLVTAADDPMRDETLAYARALQRAGVGVEQAVLPVATGWPASLQQRCMPVMPPWAEALRRALARFFFPHDAALMFA